MVMGLLDGDEFDRLVDPRLLDEAPRARRIFAGKASGNHALPQEQITMLLITNAKLTGLVALVVPAVLVPIIRRIADSGIGVLLIEQFTQLALALSHHVYVMSRGRVSYDGEPGKLREDPEILHRAYFPVSSKEAVGL